jgi:hypothetical protein
MRLAIILAVVMMAIPALAEDGWVENNAGCYEYSDPLIERESGGKMLIVRVGEDLLNAKDTPPYSKLVNIEKNGTDAGKSVYGRLIKLNPVRTVVISNREIGVSAYPFPRGIWEKTPLQDDILAIIDEVLCSPKE